MTEETIFATAIQKASEEERREFLDQACSNDPELRARVESLLRASAQAGSFFDRPPAALQPTINLGSKVETEDEDEPSPASVSLPPLEPSETPGSLGRLEGYDILEVVGQGGMGIVFRATDLKLHRIVAVKVMSRELAASAMAVKRFLREAQTAAAVVHDHVVTIHAIEEKASPPFLVMEFVQGQSLQQKLDRVGALTIPEILRIGMQTASGLAAAHKQGVIHRDVKPANILLENGVERVKITDFGVARAADDLNITRSGQITGTPQFMSPEQALAEPVDPRTDLFSLGSVLYAMCTGRPPFRADTAVAVLRRVCDDVPRPIREINPDIPDWLEQIVNRLLEKNPANRFQSASEVSELLSQHLAHLQQPTLVPRPAPLPAPIEPVTLEGTPRSPLWPRLWTVAFVLLLCAVALWRLGPHADLMVRQRARLSFDTHETDARVVLKPEGNSTAISTGPGELEIVPGTFSFDISPGHSHRELETMSLRIQFASGQEIRTNVPLPIKGLKINEGDLVVVAASFRNRSVNPANQSRWGDKLDPLQDCEFTEVDDTTLAIHIPGSYHELIPSLDRTDLSAPRVLQNWRGQFSVSVAVESFESVEGAQPAKGEMRYAGAGLLLWQNDRHFLRFFRASRSNEGLNGAYVNVQWFRDGERVGEHSTSIDDTATRLRIERRGKTLVLLYSERGGVWKPFEEIEEFGLSDEIKVGMAAVNTTTSPRDFRLEWYDLREDMADRPLPPVDSSPRRASAPFSTESAKKFQEEWAEHLSIPVEMQNSLGMTLRLIPPGDFTMGSDPEESAAARRAAKLAGFDNRWIDFTESSCQPEHRVKLTEAYYLGVHEVTVGQFKKFTEESGYVTTLERVAAEDKSKQISTWKNYRNEQPVFFLSWDDAREFCLWLSAREQRNYRLPTEAQWEFACRAGTTSQWSSGSDPVSLVDYAWFGKDKKTGPDDVGKRKPNPFGIHDMHGNVPEWCVDWHMVDYYQRSPKENPIELDQGIAQGRVLRGGSYSDLPEIVRSAARSYQTPTRGDFTNGFRVAVIGPFKATKAEAKENE